jgi:hypothetical protein
MGNVALLQKTKQNLDKKAEKGKSHRSQKKQAEPEVK